MRGWLVVLTTRMPGQGGCRLRDRVGDDDARARQGAYGRGAVPGYGAVIVANALLFAYSALPRVALLAWLDRAGGPEPTAAGDWARLTGRGSWRSADAASSNRGALVPSRGRACRPSPAPRCSFSHRRSTSPDPWSGRGAPPGSIDDGGDGAGSPGIALSSAELRAQSSMEQAFDAQAHAHPRCHHAAVAGDRQPSVGDPQPARPAGAHPRDRDGRDGGR
jgi:hypothetical protein